MKQILNISIIIITTLLTLLILLHLEKDVYYVVNGLNDRFFDVGIEQSKSYISIEEKDNLIECELNIWDNKNEILIDTIDFRISNNNDDLELYKSDSLYLFIEKGTDRSLVRKFKINDLSKGRYDFYFKLKYRENNRNYSIDINKEIIRKEKFEIREGYMGNPFILLIVLLKYILGITVLWRLYLLILTRKKNKATNCN